MCRLPILLALAALSFPPFTAALSTWNVEAPKYFAGPGDPEPSTQSINPRQYFVPVSGHQDPRSWFPRYFSAPSRKVSADEFAKNYVDLLTALINTKTPEADKDHDTYLYNKLLFSECYSPKFQDYEMFKKWLEQFVLNHFDAKIKVTSMHEQKSPAHCDFLIHVDVRTKLGPRLEFDTKLTATDRGDGWSIVFVNRNLGCD
ncbi:unnamed protein product [Caenorhabditis sp. 36 PRJEB53466]|nr:unnamed protein product [Caenorhabditis sp. 36 PRJEB53466]